MIVVQYPELGILQMDSNRDRSLKVMMVGPGSGIIGGISTLVDTILPHVNSRVQLYYFPTVSNRPSKKSGKFSFKNLSIAIEQLSRFSRSIKKFRPHLLHIHTSQGIAWLKDTAYIWIGKMMKSKVVIHIHAADYAELYTNHSKLVQAYTRYMLNKSDAVIAVSDKWKAKLSSIVDEAKIHTFMNCIQIPDETTTHPAKREFTYGLFLGSIGPRKGAFDLIDAVGSIGQNGNGIHIWLAGYEERQGDLDIAHQKLAEHAFKDRCELVGVVTGEKKRDYLERMDFFVLPSYNEGLPMAILEGMAQGRAIISTPVGGIPEVVIDGYNGYLVEPGDVQSLADRISTLADHPDLCDRMGMHSLEIVKQKLSIQSYINRLIGVYEELTIDYT